MVRSCATGSPVMVTSSVLYSGTPSDARTTPMCRPPTSARTPSTCRTGRRRSGAGAVPQAVDEPTVPTLGPGAPGGRAKGAAASITSVPPTRRAPPSTTRIRPVSEDDCGPARNSATTSATSTEAPNRGSGPASGEPVALRDQDRGHVGVHHAGRDRVDPDAGCQLDGQLLGQVVQRGLAGAVHAGRAPGASARSTTRRPTAPPSSSATCAAATASALREVSRTRAPRCGEPGRDAVPDAARSARHHDDPAVPAGG